MTFKEDLENAADKKADELWHTFPSYADYTEDHVVKAFQAGAKWGAEYAAKMCDEMKKDYVGSWHYLANNITDEIRKAIGEGAQDA